MDYGQVVRQMVDEAASEWYRAQMRSPDVHFYLMYQPSEPGSNGKLHAMREPLLTDALKDGWKMADEEPMPRNTNLDGAYAHIQGIARRLPILDPAA